MNKFFTFKDKFVLTGLVLTSLFFFSLSIIVKSNVNEDSLGNEQLGLAVPDSKWVIIDSFDGFQTSKDASKISDGANANGQNTIINDGDRISVRDLGYEHFSTGTATTTATAIQSLHTFRRRNGENIMIRTYGRIVEYFEEGKKKTAKEGEEIFLDYLGNRVPEEERVPLFDEKTKQFKVEMRSWNHFEKEAERLTKQAREFWKNKHTGKETKEWEDTPWLRFKQVDSEKDIRIKPEEAFFIADAELQEAVHRGTSVRYGGQFDEMIERMGKMKKAREFYQKVEAETDEEERWKLERQVPVDAQGLVPPGTKMPAQLLDKEIKHLEEEMLRTREQIVAQEVKIKQFKEAICHIENAEDYALKQSYKGYAETGLKAYEQSQKLKKMGEKGAKDLFIGMEHIFPEQYGGHPDELITLVENSRKRMAHELIVRKGMDESQAKELAERHIKAHLDTGHINIWRKYWVADSNKSPEKNNEEFDQWLLEKVESMAKKKMIGSVHLSDNFGYQDEHLTPGEGNAPIRKIAEILKKNGYNHPLIVEPGAAASTDLSDFHGLMKTWKLFGSSIYGAAPTGGRAQKKQWGQVQYGYFGQAESPYFVFGGYSPSEDFTLWSGVVME